jgi:uncharacterized RDD family membrane protein YckC
MICPRCGYNNSSGGTQDGRCDECGYFGFPILADLDSRGISPDIKLASLKERVLAQLFDFFVAIIVSLGSILLSTVLSPLSIIFGSLVQLIGSLFAVFYILFADGFKGGQSYGKRLMKIAVINAKSRKSCTFGQSLVRNLSLSFLGIIDWIFITLEKRQRLGDMLANTIVIKKNSSSRR